MRVRSNSSSLIAAIADSRAEGSTVPGLRVKGVRGASGVFEMTWAPNGRATFEYGTERVDRHAHIVWRRVGTDDIFDRS